MTLGEKRQLFTKLLAMFILNLQEDGYQCSLNEVLRTKEQQEIYVKTGKSKTMNSSHLSGLAADLNLFRNGELINGTQSAHDIHLRFFGVTWETMCQSNGIEPDWGGRFGVAPEDYDKKLGWDTNHVGFKV